MCLCMTTQNELARLLDCIDRLMPGITDGTVPVYVDGYCSSIGQRKKKTSPQLPYVQTV